MIETVGYLVLGIAVLAVIAVFAKVLLYAIDTISKNND